VGVLPGSDVFGLSSAPCRAAVRQTPRPLRPLCEGWQPGVVATGRGRDPCKDSLKEAVRPCRGVAARSRATSPLCARVISL